MAIGSCAVLFTPRAAACRSAVPRRPVGDSIAAASLDAPLTGPSAPSSWYGVSPLAWRQLASLHAFSGRRGTATARPLVLGWLSCRRALPQASGQSGTPSPDHAGFYCCPRCSPTSVRTFGGRGTVAAIGGAAGSVCSDSDFSVVR